MSPARPGMSVHREDAQRDAEARAEAFDEGIRLGIRLAAIYVERRGDAAMAAELRAAKIVPGTSEEPAEAGAGQ